MATFSYPELQEIEKFASEITDNKMPNDTKLYKVRSFEEMVKLVAHLRFCNQEYLLLYRGQRELYKNQNDDYSFYPSIFRPTGKYKSLQPGELKTRFKFLEKVREILRNKLPQSYLKAFEEKEDAILYSIIQHYNLAPTPVLDLTHSLQVAYSFATLENPEECNIAIFAFPHLQGTRIFYKTKPSITNVPLQYHCPPEALRPHFQEAYSIGLKIISDDNRDKSKHDQKKRLIAIIQLPNKEEDKRYKLSSEYLQLNTEEPDFIKDIKQEIEKQHNPINL